MHHHNRRSFLKQTTALAGGALALPSLSRAIQESTSPYQRPKLQITDIRTAEVVVHGLQTHVRIYTDQGLIGQGESTDAAVGTAALVRSFRRYLIGKDPLNVDALWEHLRTAGIFAGAQGGQYITALTGIEIALWDLTGKALGLPIYQLLGGKFGTASGCIATPTWKIPSVRKPNANSRGFNRTEIARSLQKSRRCMAIVSVTVTVYHTR